jgi:hypothetical protein
MSSIPWDDWAGVDKGCLSHHARRLAVLAGSSWSFDTASARLKQFCGLSLSDQTIRRATEAAGSIAQGWMHEGGPSPAAWGRSEGGGEFYTDGTCVNTRQGWREMRVGVFAKRPAGQPTSPERWRDRQLPAPSRRAAFCEISDSETFGGRWAPLAERLGWPRGKGLRSYADGAKWIWRQVREKLPLSECVVDIFHVSEHLHGCARTLYGEGTPEARSWAERYIESLVQSNPVAVVEELTAERRTLRSKSHRHALDSLLGYLKANLDGLWYRDRLRRGEPIGSGLVEGACKTIIGRRLKANSARWLAQNADAVAALGCLLYDDRWEDFWNAQAA